MKALILILLAVFLGYAAAQALNIYAHAELSKATKDNNG